MSGTKKLEGEPPHAKNMGCAHFMALSKSFLVEKPCEVTDTLLLVKGGGNTLKKPQDFGMGKDQAWTLHGTQQHWSVSF